MEQPDIVLQEEKPVVQPVPQEKPQALFAQQEGTQPAPQAQAVQPRVQLDTLQEENKRFSIIAFVVSLLSAGIVGGSFFSNVDAILLVGISAAVLGIVLAVIAQAKKKPGEKYALAALILGGLALLTAILIFIRSIVALPV